MNRVGGLVLFGLALLLPRLGWADDGVLVGILEDTSPDQQRQLESVYGGVNSAVIRVAFRKTEAGWQAFDSKAETPQELKSAVQRFPKKLEWTVAFDGEVRGHLASAAPGEWTYYSDIGLQLLLPGQTIPRIGKPDPRFHRWDAEKPYARSLS